jgi:hypothetical protein
MALCAALCALATAGAAQAERLSDPTRRIALESSSGVALERFRLSATRLSGSARSAVINGELRREGEQIDGARIRRIGHGEVLLEEDGRSIRLSLFSHIGPGPSPAPASHTRSTQGILE